MHFRSMLFVDLPETTQDPEWENQVLGEMDALKTKYPGKTLEHALFGLFLGRLTNVQTSFGRQLISVVEDAMERFYCNTEDPRYLTFEDKTEEYQTDFEKKVDCVVMPDGTIKELDSYRIIDCPKPIRTRRHQKVTVLPTSAN